MKKYKIIFTLLMLLTMNAGITFAQKNSFGKITPDLVEEINESRKSDDMFRIIIIMNEQFDSQKLNRHSQNLNKAQRREFVVNELQQISNRSQKEVLKDLQQGQKTALVNEIKSFWIFNGISCSATKEMVQAIAKRPDVKLVMKDLEIYVADGEKTEEMTSDITGNQWNVTKVNADDVWNMGYTGAGIIVAVIDSGVNYNHTDITNNMWDGGTEYPNHGWDFVNNDNDPMDDNGHGTHCAGTVSSSGTNGKQCGIAKDAKIMALKVLASNNSGSISLAISAIEFAVSHGADILSMSLGSHFGGYWMYRITLENVLNCGVITSASAGNEGNKYENGQLRYPVPYNVGAPSNCPSPWRHPDQTLEGGRAAVVAVGATTDADEHSDFSSYGPSTWTVGNYIGFYNDYRWVENNPDSIGLIKPDISAPGDGIVSLDFSNITSYTSKNGTSMAAPCVAGVMALMLSVNPTLTPLEIDSIIETTAVPCGGQTSKNNTFGAGRIDALAAVNYMLNACDAPSNLNASVNRANVTLNWDAASNVSTYRVYRNGAMIARSVSGTHFTDENVPTGNNTYFIRSNGNNHQASIPSNQVTVLILTNAEANAPTELTATEINTESNSISLSWNATPLRTESLYYTNSTTGYTGASREFIMAQRYPSSMLQRYGGMQIEHVFFSALNPDSTYTINLYEGDKMLPGILKHNGSIISSEAEQLIDYEVNPPVIINPNKDLWLTITTTDELGYDNDFESIQNDAFLYSSPSIDYWMSRHGSAWSFQLGLSDGEHTYNVSRNGSNISSNQDETSLTDTYSNGLNEYLITSVTNGYESTESNKIILVKDAATSDGLSLNDDDQLYVLPNSIFTVTGSLTNTDPANLILENGAQLIHNSTGVKATVKKDVAAYTSKLDGWNLVASPVTENITPSEDNGLISTLESDTIDLYYYSEPEHKWKNYQNQAFSIEYQKGYLYANNKEDGSTLSFAGTLTPSNETVTISNLSHSASTLNGINLVGNPFVCNATVNKDFYVMNDDRTKIVVPASDRQIAPCEGIFVQVSEADASVTFTKAGAKARSLSSSFDVTLTQGRTTLDRARVRFEGKEGLEKFSLNENTGNQIYFPQDGKGYAVVCISEQNELPLNFEAAENGTYTLSIETENVKLRHLYLIDNLTGIETDLLKTPNYTFEAKTSDYASRFRLVYSTFEDAVGDNETFAFVNNGQIIITNVGDAEDAYNASLQIIDITGRMIYQGDAKHCVSTTEMALGVYVLRLIDGENVRTQKIILK